MSEDAKLKVELNKAFGEAVHSANKHVGSLIAAEAEKERRLQGARNEVTKLSAASRGDRQSAYELITSCIPVDLYEGLPGEVKSGIQTLSGLLQTSLDMLHEQKKQS